jgi:hypothetical protein
MLSLCFLTKDS